MSNPNWQETIDNLKLRESNAVRDYNAQPSIDGRIALTDGRAADALMFIVTIMEHLRDSEDKP